MDLDLILKILDFAVKIANLGVVIWIFARNFYERRDERQRDANKEARKFMLQEFILKPGAPVINAFFANTGAIFMRAHESVESSKARRLATVQGIVGDLIAEWKKSELDKFRQSIVTPIIWVSPRHSDELSRYTDAIEDLVTECISNQITTTTIDLAHEGEKHFDDLKGQIVKFLLRMQLEFLCEVEPQGATKKSWWRF